MGSVGIFKSESDTLIAQQQEILLIKDAELKSLRQQMLALEETIDTFDYQQLTLKSRYSSELNGLRI